ncbi:MAG: hydantoinase/oxoprolinase family protein [Solirubrobacteraceae bacterium]|nr:hydantoinase/oxoprolinase family protein [Solirubrobacteraceae bacterium]
MAYLGVDIGGTFTDIVHLADDGSVVSTKVSSTPPRFEEGFIAGVEKVAGLRDVSAEELLRGCELVLHGTTVATNALVQLRGAKVGMITTRGHADTLPVMRAAGRAKGVPLDRMLHASRHDRPTAIVDRARIVEVDERMDASGGVVVALDEAGVEQAVRDLVAEGVDAIAVCYLWSVVNDDHERRTEAIIRRVAPDVFVTTSADASARTGEYERFAAAAINAFLGPETHGYLDRLRRGLADRGLQGELLVMQAAGGVAEIERAAGQPVLTIGSGPAAGVSASAVLGAQRGEADVLATDMGGTSFDVALLADGRPVRTQTTIEHQYEFHQARTDIRSIGSGGGSVIWRDPDSGALRVGPESAGAHPGPICYRRGGTKPTLTDANLVLGYLDPNAFLGGELVLDREGAEAGLAAVGEELGMSAVEVAIAAREIVSSQMADLIRQMTVERGMDPEDFVIYAYGGAGGLHVDGYVRELGAGSAVVPHGTLSTTWSAYGCATSDVMHVHERSLQLSSPFDAATVQAAFDDLERVATEQLGQGGIGAEQQSLERILEMKYPLQIHRVEVPVPSGPVTAEVALELEKRFAASYEALYGKGSAFEGAGSEIVACRVTGRGRLPQPQARGEEIGGTLEVTERDAIWPGEDGPRTLSTRVVPIDAIGAVDGGTVEGPAIITGPTTTVVVPDGSRVRLDDQGNLELRVDPTPVGAGATTATAASA